ncbi:hypothetical protein Cs7R123_46100 [Catellatospora sp. TT07R-123]|nr:hypothetical protein Cs7R123_46100 [Catellatospora sp. TT07R-123]
MFRTTLRSRVHRATVTRAELHNVGSLEPDLMDAADLLPGELIHVLDVTGRIAPVHNDPAA